MAFHPWGVHQRVIPSRILNWMTIVLSMRHIYFSSTKNTYIFKIYLNLTCEGSPYFYHSTSSPVLPSGALEHISGKSRFTLRHLNSPYRNSLITPLPGPPYHQHGIPC